MAYSSEVVRQAQDVLARRKADRESKTLQHLRTAYAKVPRLREIDQALRQTMALTAKTVFLDNVDAKAAFERVRQENLALQQERAALIAENFEEGFLDEGPECAQCGDSGYVGARMCECLSSLCRQAQLEQIYKLLRKVMKGLSKIR